MGSKIAQQVSEGKKFLVIKAPNALMTKKEALEEADKKARASNEASVSYLVVEVVSEAKRQVEVVMASLD